MAFSAATPVARRRAIPSERCGGQRRETSRRPQPCVSVFRYDREMNGLGATWAHSLRWLDSVMRQHLIPRTNKVYLDVAGGRRWLDLAQARRRCKLPVSGANLENVLNVGNVFRWQKPAPRQRATRQPNHEPMQLVCEVKGDFGNSRLYKFPTFSEL
jgi:hypothetical protein